MKPKNPSQFTCTCAPNKESKSCQRLSLAEDANCTPEDFVMERWTTRDPIDKMSTKSAIHFILDLNTIFHQPEVELFPQLKNPKIQNNSKIQIQLPIFHKTQNFKIFQTPRTSFSFFKKVIPNSRRDPGSNEVNYHCNSLELHEKRSTLRIWSKGCVKNLRFLASSLNRTFQEKTNKRPVQAEEVVEFNWESDQERDYRRQNSLTNSQKSKKRGLLYLQTNSA